MINRKRSQLRTNQGAHFNLHCKFHLYHFNIDLLDFQNTNFREKKKIKWKFSYAPSYHTRLMSSIIETFTVPVKTRQLFKLKLQLRCSIFLFIRNMKFLAWWKKAFGWVRNYVTELIFKEILKIMKFHVHFIISIFALIY